MLVSAAYPNRDAHDAHSPGSTKLETLNPNFEALDLYDADSPGSTKLETLNPNFEALDLYDADSPGSTEPSYLTIFTSQVFPKPSTPNPQPQTPTGKHSGRREDEASCCGPEGQRDYHEPGPVAQQNFRQVSRELTKD